MKLSDLIQRKVPPVPWAEGDNIPWYGPAFSQRMLEMHLSQDHDAASRRSDKIDKQVQWIHSELLSSRPSRILELACGPGLYTNHLAKLGHECVGIDYSPASIVYAKEHAKRDALSCTYLQKDIREVDYGTGFNLAMLIYGEFNVFCPTDIKGIVAKACAALNDDGLLILEPHTLAAVEKIGKKDASWDSADTGLFSEKPHLCLQERFWDQTTTTATVRYFILDAASANVSRYAVSYQAYSEQQYRSLLTDCGFEDICFYPSLTGQASEAQEGLVVIVARKQASP